MMSQRIVTLCDACQKRGEERLGEPWSIKAPNGKGKPRAYDVDLCADDAAALRELVDFLAVDAAASASALDDLEKLMCPDCDHGPFKAPQGVAAHRRVAHGRIVAKSDAAS